jgi:hypothetical protein
MIREATPLAAAALLASILGGCTAPAPRPEPPRSAPAVSTADASPAEPRPLTLPGGTSSPKLSSAPDGRLVLSWLEVVPEGTALRWMEWKDGTWSDPRAVVRGTDVVLNWADLPGVVPLSGGGFGAHWLARQASPSTGIDVRVALSIDGGSTWSPAVVPHRDATSSEHGFVTLFDARDGGAGIAWLDGRASVAGSPEWATAVMETTLRTDGALEDERVIDPRACDCCPTSIARTASSTLLAWRDRSDDGVRDIAVARHPPEGSWSAPAAAHRDGWRVDGCPVNGPALAARGELVALAWFTAAGDEPRVRLAFSADGGSTFGAAFQVDDGQAAGQPDVVLLDDDSAVVSWLESDADGRTLRLRRFARLGAHGPSSEIARLGAGPGAGRPQLERAGDRLVVAWTAAAGPHVEVAVLEPPPA